MPSGATRSGRLASSNECAHEHAIDLWCEFVGIEPGLREPFTTLRRGIDPGWLDFDRLKAGCREFCAIVRLLQCTRDASRPQFDMASDFAGNFTARDHIENRQAASGLEYSKRFAQNAILVAREIYHAIRNDHVDGIVGQRNVLDLAL